MASNKPTAEEEYQRQKRIYEDNRLPNEKNYILDNGEKGKVILEGDIVKIKDDVRIRVNGDMEGQGQTIVSDGTLWKIIEYHIYHAYGTGCAGFRLAQPSNGKNNKDYRHWRTTSAKYNKLIFVRRGKRESRETVMWGESVDLKPGGTKRRKMDADGSGSAPENSTSRKRRKELKFKF